MATALQGGWAGAERAPARAGLVELSGSGRAQTVCLAPAVKLGAQVKGVSQQNQSCLLKSVAGVTSAPLPFPAGPDGL